MKKTFLKATCFSLALISAPVLAEFKGVAHVGYELGGDEVYRAWNKFTGATVLSINAGDGMVLAAGAAYIVNPEVSIQTTLGWKYQGSTDDTYGVSASFTRFPVDVLAQYSQSNLRLGAGLTYHLNPTVSGISTDYKLDSGLGMVLQFDYTTEAKMTWGLRYTDLTYSKDNVDFDAGSFGVHMTGQF